MLRSPNMATRAEIFYAQLLTEEDLAALIGKPEDGVLECKQWRGSETQRRGTFAKAISGLANAVGGVLVIGMQAKSQGPNQPDLIEALAPIPNKEAALSELLDIILRFTEPALDGLEHRSIPTRDGGTSGYIVLFVPEVSGTPVRDRTDARFYLRITSATVPMEYFQIAERFGKRPQPKLVLHYEVLEKQASSGYVSHPVRKIRFGLRNTGRAIARYPAIRFRRSSDVQIDDFGLDGNGNQGLPSRSSDPGWLEYRGGADDVIYPEETREIGHLVHRAGQPSERLQGQPTVMLPRMPMERIYPFRVIEIEYQIYAESMPEVKGALSLPEDEYIQPFLQNINPRISRL